MYCPDCGAGVRSGSNYCLNCGFDLRGVEPLTEPPAIDDSPTDPGRHAAASDEQATARTHGRSRGSSGPTMTVPTLEAEPVPGSRLKTCPACGAPNSGHRTLCGRCGVDLSSGQRRSVHPAASPVAPDPSPDEEADRRRGRRVLFTVIAINVVLGLVLGLLWKFGPFSSDGGGASAAPTFDAGVYAGASQPLGVGAATATTVRASVPERSFAADLLVDDDLGTAWQNDGSVRAEGLGSLLTLELSEPAWITELLIANGDQASEEDYAAAARVKRLRLLFDNGAAFDVVLLDQQGLQSVRIDPPGLTGRVRMEVVESYGGASLTSVALSEIRLRGYTAVGADRAYVESSGS